MVKVCSKCGVEKEESSFYSGRVCKECRKENRKSRVGCKVTAAYNKEYAKTRQQEYTELRKEQAKVRYQKNKGRMIEMNKEWRKNNPEKVRCKEAKRRATKLNATLKLTCEQEAKIKRLYSLAKFMESCTGLKYHVDHIIPLKGKHVCGLHTPENLQVLRADLNLSKSNSYKDYKYG